MRGVLKLAEAMAVIPLVKRALPEARLPMQDARRSGRWAPRRSRGGRSAAAGARRSARGGGGARLVLPALLALRSGDLAAYHGVEHKAIAAYEQDGDAADATKEHDRCGSHLVAPMLAAALGNVAAPGRPARPGGRAAVGLGSAAVAVEVFAWAERHPDTRLRGCCAGPATRSSAWSARASRRRSSSRWGARRSTEILRVEGAAG